jgi:hypothetical protein
MITNQPSYQLLIIIEVDDETYRYEDKCIFPILYNYFWMTKYYKYKKNIQRMGFLVQIKFWNYTE